MEEKRRGKEITIMELGDMLKGAKKVDPQASVKVIIRISPYDQKIIEQMKKAGLDLEFEMPLREKICGTIHVGKHQFLTKLEQEGKISEIEVCGQSSVEVM